jgi:NitT/TauT family transport system permease protein
VLPLLVAVQAVPKVAIAPLLIVWMGFGPSSKIVLVTLLCFFPVVVSTMAGLAATPSELVELARSLEGSRPRTFVKVRIPWALPQVFTGLKLAGSLALIGAVVAQITTPNAGLGAVIVRSGQSADTPLAFAAITLLAAIGISLFYSLVGLERLLLPWARATTA